MPHIDATGLGPWPDEPATSDMTRLTVDHHPDDMIRFIEVNGMSTLDEMGPETLPDDVRQTTRPNAMVPNAQPQNPVELAGIQRCDGWPPHPPG